MNIFAEFKPKELLIQLGRWNVLPIEEKDSGENP